LSASGNADSGESARFVVGAVASGVETSKAKVAEHAQGEPIVIGAADTLEEAIRIMQRHQVRRLPVIGGHRLVGMLSQADTARHADEHRTAPARWSRKFPSPNRLPCTQQMAASLPEAAIAHFARKTLLAPVGVRSTAPVVQAAGSLHCPIQSVKENQDTPAHNDPQGTG